METYSDFLFSRPSFLDGIGRLIDFGGTMNVYNESLFGGQADRIALRMDMRALGIDFIKAAEIHNKETNDERGTQDQ